MPLLSAPPAGHRVLLIEDHPPTCAMVEKWLTARGYRVRAVATVEEAFQAMQEEDFCLFIVDQELPFATGDAPTAAGGPRIIEAIRNADPRRVGLAHLTPVLVYTGFSVAPDFIWRMRDIGADAFVAKGALDSEEKLLGEVANRLLLAGRADHAGCAAFAAELAGLSSRTPAKAVAGKPGVPVTIYVEGKDGPRTVVKINGEPRGMQDAKFLILLLLLAKSEQPGHAWSERDELGIENSREAISRVRAVFRGLTPKGFDPIQSDRSGRFRLHPEVLVTFIPWDELEEHPHPGVRKVAARQNAWQAEEDRREASAGGVDARLASLGLPPPSFSRR